MRVEAAEEVKGAEDALGPGGPILNEVERGSNPIKTTSSEQLHILSRGSLQEYGTYKL